MFSSTIVASKVSNASNGDHIAATCYVYQFQNMESSFTSRTGGDRKHAITPRRIGQDTTVRALAGFSEIPTKLNVLAGIQGEKRSKSGPNGSTAH